MAYLVRWKGVVLLDRGPNETSEDRVHKFSMNWDLFLWGLIKNKKRQLGISHTSEYIKRCVMAELSNNFLLPNYECCDFSKVDPPRKYSGFSSILKQNSYVSQPFKRRNEEYKKST